MNGVWLFVYKIDSLRFQICSQIIGRMSIHEIFKNEPVHDRYDRARDRWHSHRMLFRCNDDADNIHFNHNDPKGHHSNQYNPEKPQQPWST